MEDASLEEFLDDTAGGDEGVDGSEPEEDGCDADDSSDTAREGDGDGGTTGSTDADHVASPGPESADSTDADRTRSTYAWDPAGVACPDCGAVVGRRWRDGDRFVCAECKAW